MRLQAPQQSNGLRTGLMMTINRALLSSERTTWETPPELFRKLNDEFRFDLDVCAFPENAKCDRFYCPDVNGLIQEWAGRCWCNPPYGRGIGDWIEKAARSAETTADVVVCLVPARTDTAWWHDWAVKASEIRFLRGRVRFVGAVSCAPFPSAVLVFRRRWWELDGAGVVCSERS